MLLAFVLAIVFADAAAAPPWASFDFDLNGRTLTLRNASSDSDGRIVAQQWDFGDGNVSGEVSPVHTYAGNGSYTVRLTVIDDDGETATAYSPFAVRVNVCDRITLDNGSIVAGIRLRQDFCPPLYQIDVPYGAGDLVLRFEPGADAVAAAGMSVRYGEPPSYAAFDCRIGGNIDPTVCVIPAPIAGTYYARVETAGDLYSGRLAVRFVHADAPNPPRDLRVATTLISPTLRRTTLTWERGADQVTILRRGGAVATTTNWGTWSIVESLWSRPMAPSYRVCNAGTAECAAIERESPFDTIDAPTGLVPRLRSLLRPR